MELKLIAEPRESKGKGGARKTRAAGRVPGVLYGHGSDPLSVSVDDRELVHALHTDAGQNVLLNLVLDGEEILAMPREVQRNLLRGKLVHVDFLRIARDEKIAVEVPILLLGEAVGVREEGASSSIRCGRCTSRASPRTCPPTSRPTSPAWPWATRSRWRTWSSTGR